MLLEAVYHRPKLNWSYAYDHKTLHLRLRAKKNDLTEVYAFVGDKYMWDQSKELIPMTLMISDEMFDYWECTYQPPLRRTRYGFLLKSGDEQIWMTESEFTKERPSGPERLFEFPFINPVDVFTPPAWVKDAIFYQIFPERFANGDPSNDPKGVLPWGGKPERDNFFGGDLQGVIDHLDHLSELGITGIYFTPLFEATTNHKYDTADYMKIDPHFGDIATVKKLVQACHERGIKVLFDAVFNHSGRTFAPFVDVMEKGEKSRYKDWFHVREYPLQVKDGVPSYDTFAFEPLMPKLNTENPEVKEYLLKVAEFWIKEVGIDGWRLDVANEVDHAFWRDFRKVVKAANPDAYILGEIWHESSAWLQGDQFDAVMNYPFTEAVLDFVVRGTLDAEGFANAIGKQLSRYPLQASEVAFNLLDSHDTPRLLTLCDGNKAKMKLAALFQFTYSGTPCIYYGDEVGLDGGPDPDCRKCMEWDPKRQDRDLFAFYQKLIKVRKQLAPLRTGSLKFLLAEKGGSKLAYERVLNGEKVLVLLNNYDAGQTFTIPADGKMWRDTFSGQTYNTADGKLAVKLPAYGYAVLTQA
ncbi:cyclomaltodextrinase [Paenibacillus sp. oral taxon 786 str. D14]|uniref:alpha-glycosidase n=1 Tax=Paenibacillus sp. oral taxon 786 TaxID=652715 RepID=UPI0001AFD2ED|nr:alpha-glycosidase [Paenibacillus sp. oral taxon 786]EES74165.1 cyclomaltodextrinase [Paenibacillus sp. oral taxon 786 str. D14]